MTPSEIRTLANETAQAILQPPDSVASIHIEAAILSAIKADREADDRMDDPTLFLPVAFVRQQNAVFEERIAGLQGQLAAVRAALNCEAGQDAETVGRALYHEREDLARWKVEALTVESWWNEIDAFIRKHPDSPLGRDVSKIALEWLKERDEFKAKSAKYYGILELWGVLHNTPPLVVGDEGKELFDQVFRATCDVLTVPKTP